jgi:hypothetical protein
MITSGIDEFYGGGFLNPYVETAIQDAQCAGIVVFSIYTPAAGHLGHSFWRFYWGQLYLSELSEETGGESYYLMGPQPAVSFAPYLSSLTRQLNEQYVLTFLAEPRAKPGPESVKVRTEIHSVDLLAADKICIPASPLR